VDENTNCIHVDPDVWGTAFTQTQGDYNLNIQAGRYAKELTDVMKRRNMLPGVVGFVGGRLVNVAVLTSDFYRMQAIRTPVNGRIKLIVPTLK